MAGIPGAGEGSRIGRFAQQGRPLEGPVAALVYLHQHIDIEYDVFGLGKTESRRIANFLRFSDSRHFSFS